MKTIYLKPLFLILLVNFLFKSEAQSSYRFESTSVNYVELIDAKKISFKLLDDMNGLYRLSELEGQKFRWFNTSFNLDSIKTFHIQPYANLRFDNDSSLIIVDGAFTYLDSINESSSISYSIEGSTGEKLIKVQWKNLKVRVGKADNFVNLQIWVNQKTGVFEIHYGPVSANNQSGFNTSTGPQVGIFYSRDNFTKCYEKLWIKGSPTDPKQDSLANYSFLAMSGIPLEGVVYRFIPKFKDLSINDKITKKQLMISPNPIHDGWLNLTEFGNYEITDGIGKSIISVHDERSIDVGSLKSGIYFIRSSNGYLGKFVIE